MDTHTRHNYFLTQVGTGLVAGVLAFASVAASQPTTADARHDVRRLGTASAFYSPPLKTADSLKRMAAKRGIADDIRLVLRDAGIPDTADAVIATLAGATATTVGGACADATPADGNIVACTVAPSTDLLWMVHRPAGARGKRAPGRLDRVRWAGARPFKAFLFRVTNDYTVYTFVLPLQCANLSLLSVTPIVGAPVDISVDRACDAATGRLRATITASGKDLARVQRVRVSIDGQPAGELTAPSWTLTSDKAGTYTFDATDAKGRTYPMAKQSLRVEACPAPPAPEPVRVVSPTCSIVLTADRVKRTYTIALDASQSTTGATGIAPTVTVDVRDAAGKTVSSSQVLDKAQRGTVNVRTPGIYTATATVTTPESVVVDNNRYEGTTTCDATVTIERPASSTSIFFDVLGGKERRVRPIEDTDLEFGQCSPLLGAKLGLAKRLRNDWEIAGAVGVAVSLVGDDDKVNESALFVDAEVNKYLPGGVFLGSGVSLWDLTRSDTITPAWLVHFGIPLTKTSRMPVYFVGEGRVFLDHADDIASNYQFWGGVRVHFRR